MNDTTTGTTYWFTEHGEWGTVPVSHVFFGPEHHANMHESFDMVNDSKYPDWAMYLAARPHELASTGGVLRYCTNCEDLADQFGIM